jgi:6,7-dimethyl-8-ribityllumazine synthase
MLNSNNGIKQAFDASKLKIGVVVAQFNSDITSIMLEKMIQSAADYNLTKDNFVIIWTPGSVEIPFVLQNLAPKVDCAVAIGCVIRGDTPHFDYVCKYATEGIMRVSLDKNIAVGYGLLTLETHDQANSRLLGGFWALEAALQSWKEVEAIKN